MLSVVTKCSISSHFSKENWSFDVEDDCDNVSSVSTCYDSNDEGVRSSLKLHCQCLEILNKYRITQCSCMWTNWIISMMFYLHKAAKLANDNITHL